jgi:hypothetical protein
VISNLSLATGGAEALPTAGVTSTLSGGLAFECALESVQDTHWSKSRLTRGIESLTIVLRNLFRRRVGRCAIDTW